MAKGKYEYWLTPEGLLKLEGWARDGLTDEQIAQNIGISRSTLNAWKERYSDISDTLKRGKEVVDRKVENALLKRALGYTYNEDKYICVPMDPVEYSEKLAEYMNRYKLDHPEATDDELMLARESFPKVKQVLAERKVKEVVPDTTAQIFWLKNRKRETWADRQNIELSQPIDESIKEMEAYFEQQKESGSGPPVE
ncbi:helix-turn-helix domain-containing protein [Frisingicoccus sp.]|uniref:helix-turn-helix domain-containing protein n=1 Tax=Frisingicoccus sp. TaxID=1918627 RepID=UPI003AB20C06